MHIHVSLEEKNRFIYLIHSLENATTYNYDKEEYDKEEYDKKLSIYKIYDR